MSRRTRGIGGFVGEALLNLAAIGGLICLVLVVLAFAFNVTLIMFKTGSMGPTIPAGSLALVREIPASQIRIGDVVTVDRPAVLPITHRVTSVAAGPSGAERVITLKGDGCEAEDPSPYEVSTVRIVLASVPGLAYAGVWLSNPWVLAALALGASALVTWAFWPREPRDRDGDGDGADARTHAGGGDGVALGPPEQHGRHRRTASVFLVAPILVAIGLALIDPAPSHAAPTEQVIEGEYLTLVSIGDPSAMTHLTPGEPVQWQVGVSTSSTGPGEVRIGLLGSGSAGLGLYAMISSCDQRWIDGGCATGATVIQASGPVAVDETERPLAVMPVTEERWLLFDLWLEADAAAPVTEESVQLQVHASGSGDDVTASPELLGTMPGTGVDPLLPVLGAAGAIVLGLGLGLAIAGVATLRKRRTR